MLFSESEYNQLKSNILSFIGNIDSFEIGNDFLYGINTK